MLRGRNKNRDFKMIKKKEKKNVAKKKTFMQIVYSFVY